MGKIITNKSFILKLFWEEQNYCKCRRKTRCTTVFTHIENVSLYAKFGFSKTFKNQFTNKWKKFLDNHPKLRGEIYSLMLLKAKKAKLQNKIEDKQTDKIKRIRSSISIYIEDEMRRTWKFLTIYRGVITEIRNSKQGIGDSKYLNQKEFAIRFL